MLRVKVKELSTDPEFKASLGWYSNWKRRHSISMRAKTSLAQRLPADMEDKVVEFHRFVLRSRQRWGYDLSRILNMDETPCGLSCRPPEPWSLPGAEQFQCCPAEPTSRVSRLLWPWKRTVKNSHQKSFSKVFDNWISTHHQGYRFQYTRKAGWTKKVFFFLHNAYFREDTSRVSDTIIGIQNEVKTIVLLSRISCYWARAVKHVCSTYANSVCLLFSWSCLVF